MILCVCALGFQRGRGTAVECIPLCYAASGTKLGSVCAVNRRSVRAHMHYATNICPSITRPAVSLHYSSAITQGLIYFGVSNVRKLAYFIPPRFFAIIRVRNRVMLKWKKEKFNFSHDSTILNFD